MSMGAEEADPPPPEAGAFALVVIAWAYVGCVLLAVVVLLNVWAVIGPLLGMPFAGDFELTEMGVAVAVFTFLPYCQLTGQNVSADIFTSGAGPRTLAILMAIGSVAALVFSVILIWRMWLGMLDQRAFSYATTILQVPVWWAFVPIMVSLVMLLIASLVTLTREVKDAT